jgi:prepilin-type N-terminal cleavage/methylation domain-containing protein
MKKNGFTLIEMTVVLAVVAILAAILAPTIIKNIRDAQITRATNEEQVIASAIMSLYKDTGKWPYTNTDGPAGGVCRVLTGNGTDRVPTLTASGAQTGAANWGSLGPIKQLYDYLYWNNPDEDTMATNANETGQDYPVSGDFAWRGPYIDRMSYVDPWGNQYVISARYFPGNTVAGVSISGHQALVLSAGPDGLWSTAFADAITRNSALPGDSPFADDIGLTICTNN